MALLSLVNTLAISKLLHKDLRIDPILDFIKNQSTKFFNRLPQIPNQSIRVIPASDNSVSSSAKRPRAALHHLYQPPIYEDFGDPEYSLL
ncbi:hypothetical protein TNCV_3914521 [Trichonephila clavipes]|nr:hypothetical protein TNCV_3914521 [Trichonephila clavipes]